MKPSLHPLFRTLRALLEKHAAELSVSDDRPSRYCLEGPVGPATLRAWGGKAKRSAVHVAWVEIGKTYVSYHLMPIYVNPKLMGEMSNALKERMHGKSCFNFKTTDDALVGELETLTGKAIQSFRRAGYIAT